MTDKTKEFIEKAIQIHGDKYDYSKVEYIKQLLEVIIICKKHSEFLQTPKNHLSGNGCSKCSGRYNYTTEEYIEKAIKIHGDKYDYSKIKFANSHTKVIIICKEHGEFTQKICHHINRKQGCSKCSKKYNYTTEEYIEQAKIIHHDKYDYRKVNYINSQTKIIIICKNHGEFEQKPNSHLQGQGCSNCSLIKRADNRKYNITEFIEKSKSVHGNKYNYNNVEYVRCDTKVIIICKEHGEFLQTPESHLSGNGCSKCSGRYNYTTEEYIEKAIQIHGDKYDYSKVEYINNKIKITIICKEHGEFLQTPNKHLYRWCPTCQTKKQYSQKQISWLNFLELKDNTNIQHAENNGEFTIPNTRYKADGFCKETNTVYEFHGDYWHGNPKVFIQTEINKTTNCSFGELYKKTIDKEKQIKELGYNLVVMWEFDWDNINKSIKKIQRKFHSSKQK